jgi:hypothetical protein
VLAEVAYSALLRGDESRTRITVNTKIEGQLKATATQQATNELSCFSRGVLERDLLHRIAREAP